MGTSELKFFVFRTKGGFCTSRMKSSSVVERGYRVDIRPERNEETREDDQEHRDGGCKEGLDGGGTE